jgi:hypothetical protein
VYSGTTLTKFSGRILGAHQKIDRVAYRHLRKLTPAGTPFPPIRSILSFEGKNGPDGIKRKSPARDEPGHYFDPFGQDEQEIFTHIREHYDQLVKHLKQGNQERAAFEAAWLAHSLVDGLTPAHHYPYEEELAKLRGGEGNETRTTVKDKIVLPGDNRREKVKNNWKMWGPRGLLTSHGLFEIGIATLIMPATLGEAAPSKKELETAREIGVVELFRRAAREIAVLDMFESYHRKGWTPKLAHRVRHKLGPTIVQTVTLTWYNALVEAGLIKGD